MYHWRRGGQHQVTYSHDPVLVALSACVPRWPDVRRHRDRRHSSLRRHASGKGAKFARSNPTVRVLATQAFASKSEALKAEAALKKLDRTEKLAWARLCADE